MTTDLPEGVRGRVVAVLLLVAVLGGVWAGIVAPLTDWYATRSDRIERETILARRMTQIVGTLPALRAQEAATVSAAPVAVLEGGSDAVAGATLQGRLQQIAGSVGATLASTEVLPGEPVGGYRRIGVRLSVEARWPVIVRLLAAVDENTPRLLVDDVHIQAQPATPSDPDPLLNVTMVVFGFRAGGAS